MYRPALICLSACSALVLTGCAKSYRTPGGPASMNLFIDREISREFERTAAATTPVYLALVRVQESGYRAYSERSYGHGRFSVATVRDEAERQRAPRLNDLPKIAQSAWLNRLLLPETLNSEKDLRVAAASLHADMLLIYTYDTRFHTGDALSPLTVLSLGLSPHQQVTVDTTTSAVLLDVRTGFVYGVCEGNASQERIASAWTNRDQVDRSRRQTESDAFTDMMQQFESLWPSVVADLPAKDGSERYAKSSKGGE